MTKSAKAPRKSPARARRDEEKEERRQAIIKAAEKVIARHGWEDTNFGEIARRTRLSRSLVYFYFPTREDLFNAVCERGLADLYECFCAATKDCRTGLEQLMALGRAYHEFSKTAPLHFEILTRMHAQEAGPKGKGADGDAVEDNGEKCLGFVAQVLARGVADGSIRKSIGDPVATAVAVWALTHGLIQIAAQKEAMLKQHFGLTPEKTMAHGFALLRGAVAASVE